MSRHNTVDISRLVCRPFSRFWLDPGSSMARTRSDALTRDTRPLKRRVFSAMTVAMGQIAEYMKWGIAEKYEAGHHKS